ncbi:hypothetical protein CEXT_49981 [Caerostris extrusa]|uniref:Uncharacterized protein n=1 Tax=Caerostris extrusa TaxID=172846 RepID=A0AAV4V2G1_CAEEX|nr:hypothetical protein CEXT_49981 [Caerostris extrusa]
MNFPLARPSQSLLIEELSFIDELGLVLGQIIPMKCFLKGTILGYKLNHPIQLNSHNQLIFEKQKKNNDPKDKQKKKENQRKTPFLPVKKYLVYPIAEFFLWVDHRCPRGQAKRKQCSQ